MTSILPPNASETERAIEAAGAARLDALSVAIAALWSAGDCPEDFLPWLAWALSVDVWRPHWPADIKRQVIASSYDVHVAKGTRAGVEAALDALDVKTRIVEWFEPGGSGEPYTYRLRALASRALNPASPAIVDQDFAGLVGEILSAVAPLRSRVSLETGAAAPFPLALAACGRGAGVRRSSATLVQEPIRPAVVPVVHAGAALASVTRFHCQL